MVGCRPDVRFDQTMIADEQLANDIKTQQEAAAKGNCYMRHTLRHGNHAATPLAGSRKPSEIFNFASILAFIERCEIGAKSDLVDTSK
jgi:hypothetical protein